MFRLNRFVALAALLGAFPASMAAGQPARDDIGTADVRVSAPVKTGKNAPISKVLTWVQPLATYNNGGLVTHVGGGFGGADASRLQNTSLGMTTVGFSASAAGALRIADDFIVPAGGWTVNSVTFFGYQTGSTTTSTFNIVRLQIWKGAPNAGGVVVFGDTTTNRFGSTAFSNTYRDSETTVANSTRPIMATTSNAIGASLIPGTHYVDFQLGGTLASGPFLPPLTTLGSTSGTCVGTCNAIQWSGTAWAGITDAGTLTPQDVKFVIDFTLAPVELLKFSIE